MIVCIMNVKIKEMASIQRGGSRSTIII